MGGSEPVIGDELRQGRECFFASLQLAAAKSMISGYDAVGSASLVRNFSP